MAKQDPQRIVFTKRRLEGLPVPVSGRACWRDAKTPGLALYITTSDTRTFYVYKKVRGKPTRFRLGTFPQVTVAQARELAADVLAQIARGEDPQAKRQAKRGELTFGDLWEHWRDDYAIPHGVKSVGNFTGIYGNYLLRWAKRPASEITQQEVQAIHHEIGKDRKSLANKIVQIIRAVYSRAIKDRIYSGDNPAKDLEQFRENARDRFVQDHELPRLFDALLHEKPQIMRFFYLAILTGARRSNLCSMRWEEIDGDHWRIPAEKSKNDKPIVIPLVIEAIEVLEQQRASVGNSEWVFPSNLTNTGHLNDPSRAWQRIRRRADLEDVRIHDLRRTIGSYAASGGTSLPIIGRMLGHSAGSQATRVYARLKDEPVRQAFDEATATILSAGRKGARRA